MCEILKPMLFTEGQYYYQENENVNEIYFLINGEAAFVLPRYNNTPFITIQSGQYFGVMDIVGSC